MSFINRAAISKSAKDSPIFKARGYTRISGDFFDAIDRVVAAAVESAIHAGKSGKTLTGDSVGCASVPARTAPRRIAVSGLEKVVKK